MILANAKIKEISYLNPHVLECVLKCNVDVTAQPGQYILIKINDAWRPFSVAEIHKKRTIVLVIQLISDTLTANFFQSVSLGTEIELGEPQGKVELPDKSDVIFVATGTGIVPLYTIAKSLLERGYKHEINIIFGLKDETKLFYEKKLEVLTELYSNCNVVTIISSPSAGWEGLSGRVDSYITQHFAKFKNHQFYVCGKPETVVALTQYLESMGVPDSKINFIE